MNFLQTADNEQKNEIIDRSTKHGFLAKNFIIPKIIASPGFEAQNLDFLGVFFPYPNYFKEVLTQLKLKNQLSEDKIQNSNLATPYKEFLFHLLNNTKPDDETLTKLLVDERMSFLLQAYADFEIVDKEEIEELEKMKKFFKTLEDPDDY